MKLKHAITMVLSCTAALCTTIGTGAYIKSAANQLANTPTPVVATEDRAYFVGKSESVLSYEQDNNSEVMGLRASLFNEDTLTLRNVIDLNDMHQKSQSFLEILPIAEEIGFSDYKSIIIEMIDVYNKDNFLTIKMSSNPDNENGSGVSYFLACANNGQKLTGYEWDGNPQNTGKLHVDNDFGQWSYYAFGDIDGKKGGTGFYYNVETKSIYAKPLNGSVKKQIIDLDDPAFFGSYLWEGFTSNEVYCTVRCVDYKREMASFLVSKYGDYDLSKVETTDEVAPILTIELGDYTEESLPKGLINYSYPLFNATARDAFDGAVDTNVKVVFGYDTTNPQEMEVKNGAFRPNEPGKYRICYSATDAHGNTAEKYLYADVENSYAKLSVSFDNVVTEIMEGDLYRIPAYTVSNALGNATTEIKATLNDKAIEVTEQGIRPFGEGEMKITYTIKDYVGRKVTQTHTITVNEAAKPTFIEEPLLPKRLVVGNTYSFPALNAYDYVTAQGDAIPTEIYVKENGEERKLENGKYLVGSVSEAEIIYKATIGNAEASWSTSLPVYGVTTNGYFDMSKYFLPMDENGSVESTVNSVDLCANAAENATFEFVNYVTVYPFITEFTYGENPTRIGKFHIYLTDVKDTNKVLKFTYDFKGGVATFYVNDNQNLKSEVSVALQEGGRNQLAFKADEKAVYFDINRGSGFPISTFYNGQEYTGFTNERVYVKYVFENVTDAARIKLNMLNLSYLSNDNGDYMAPLVSLLGKVGGERTLNEVVELPEIVSNDIFSGDVDAYITVKSPSGQFVTTEDGKLLNNFLYDQSLLKMKLTEHGKYVIHVTARDDAGNEGIAAMAIRVVDTEMPTMNLSGNVVKNAKVGDKITLPTATVSDNLTQNCTIKVYVFNPNGQLLEMKEGDKGFIPMCAGVYTIVYYVIDEAGNFAFQRFTVTVR